MGDLGDYHLECYSQHQLPIENQAASDVDPTKSPMPWRFQVQSLHQTWDAAWGNGQQQQTWGNMGSSFIADLD